MVVTDDLLEINEAREGAQKAQAAQLVGEEERSQEEKKILTALALRGRSNCGGNRFKIESKSKKRTY